MGPLARGVVLMLSAVLFFGAAGTRDAHAQFINSRRTAPNNPRRALDSAATKFFEEWGVQWRSSQMSSLPVSMSPDRSRAVSIASYERRPHFHCHRSDIVGLNEELVRRTDGYMLIPAAQTTFSVCPTWPIADSPVFPDEDGDIDAALLPSQRERVRVMRARVLELLEQTVRENPKDNFLIGQHVRFLIDQRLADSARNVARSCAADRWWCLTLQGYAEFRMNERSRAESSFVSARAAMTPADRCEWDDVLMLSPNEFFQTNERNACYARDLFSTRYWWLSDPMWSVPGNERHLEHIARTAEVKIRMGFGYDGRMHWLSEKGGDALQRMLTRYGWPSYTAWGGLVGDASHDKWLASNGSLEQPPYITYEYSRGRVHTAPDWEVLSNPFAATDSSWQLNEPMNFSWRKRWWPEDFVKRAVPLRQLPRGQTALLRRKIDIIVAQATDVSPLDSVRVRAGSSATLLVSTGPDSIITLGTSVFTPGATVFTRGRMAPYPALLALELRDVFASDSRQLSSTRRDSVLAEARTRFGIIPPATLDEMRPGEVAISEALLLRAPESGPPPPVRADSLLDTMLGSVTVNVRDTPRVGLYWETYGVAARDSVTIGLRVERKVAVGGMRRLGMALRLTGDPNAAVNISWREPDIGRITSTIDGPVPIQSRTLVLDLSRLEPGPYDLVMSVAKMRGTPASSVKRIVIAR